ncbi:MAG: YlxQ-related RNA-binding protein [Candidatus Izemoplasmatales bacterium]
MMNKDAVLKFLGLCQKSRKLVSGEAFSIEKIKNKQAKLVFLASDAGYNTNKRVREKCEFYQVQIIDDFDTLELSSAIGKNNRKVLAVIDHGFTAKLKTLL